MAQRDIGVDEWKGGRCCHRVGELDALGHNLDEAEVVLAGQLLRCAELTPGVAWLIEPGVDEVSREHKTHVVCDVKRIDIERRPVWQIAERRRAFKERRVIVVAREQAAVIACKRGTWPRYADQ